MLFTLQFRAKYSAFQEASVGGDLISEHLSQHLKWPLLRSLEMLYKMTIQNLVIQKKRLYLVI